MKHLMERFTFIDCLDTNDDELNRRINKPFLNDANLPELCHGVKIKWNIYEGHSIIQKIKDRTNFRSTSEFNHYFNKVIEQLFTEHFKEMDKDGIYALEMAEKTFFIITDITYSEVISIKPRIYIKTINDSSPNNYYKKILIDDEYFNIDE